jgi:choline dehydrogenase
MAAEPITSLVDAEIAPRPDLRVRGVDNLWSADASIIPDLVSGNTNALCTMIGEKLGRALAVNSH